MVKVIGEVFLADFSHLERNLLPYSRTFNSLNSFAFYFIHSGIPHAHSSEIDIRYDIRAFVMQYSYVQDDTSYYITHV